MTLGEKIYELRKNKGVSQETLAYDLNVSRQAVSKWETDQSIPDLDKIKSLSEYFGVSIDYLVNNVVNEQIVENDLLKTEEQKDLDKTNKLKRIARIMLMTVIAFNIVILLNFIILTLLQNVFIGRTSTHHMNEIFVIPYIYFIQTLLNKGAIIVFSFYLLNKLKFNNNIVIDKVIFIIIFYSLSFLINVIFGVITNNYLSSFSSHYPIKYSYLINFIDMVNSLINMISSISFPVALGILIVVSFIDKTKYKLPSKKEEYKTSDLLFCLFNGMLFGVYGLIFEIILLVDVKKDNVERFKKMRFWYLIGLVCSIPLILIEFVYVISHIPFF